MFQKLVILFTIALLSLTTTALASSTIQRRSILVTGANKGQGFALCERILSEHDDTHVFLCSRDLSRGQEAVRRLLGPENNFDPSRVDMVQLDVTDKTSILDACQQVEDKLLQNGSGGKLYGLVSNAGILWGHTLAELFDVCTVGVRDLLDAFLPLMDPNKGRVVVVSSGLGPLMHGYSSQEHQELLKAGSDWETLSKMMDECLQVAKQSSGTNNNDDNTNNGPKNFEMIGFPGGPFAEAVPDFHMYGLAKMFGDAYMLSFSKANPNLQVNSCDPGLVYTDLIGKMPRYKGQSIEETGAQTPWQGCEAAQRLLFGVVSSSGKFYALAKDGSELLYSEIDKMPNK